MTVYDDPKAVLLRYLTVARSAVRWKVDGLSEYDVRRPMTPTGTNLLGVVKHLAAMEAGYFGDCLGRPLPDLPDWYAALMDDTLADNGDMWATAEESREAIVDLYTRACAHADAVLADLDLDATGTVSWWGEGGETVPVHVLLVHMIAETNRHTGQMDIVRELVDGATGMRADAPNLPEQDVHWWVAYRQRLQESADRFR
ncbi:DinB family protein [Knoellia locipacati]|uniref:DinB family protein n=1 Tax=Knoellia locipacati TaxID=882824 RepID=UPI001FE725B5|nr:DinB family protein [Knoellia locipacati]